jgi:hypothetical protein
MINVSKSGKKRAKNLNELLNVLKNAFKSKFNRISQLQKDLEELENVVEEF